MPFDFTNTPGFETIEAFSFTALGPQTSHTISFDRPYGSVNIFFSNVTFDVLSGIRVQASGRDVNNAASIPLTDANDYTDGFSTATISNPSAVGISMCGAVTANPAVPEFLSGSVNMLGCDGSLAFAFANFPNISPRYYSQIIRHSGAAFIGGASVYGILTPWLATGSGAIRFIDGLIFTSTVGGATLFQSGDFYVQGAQPQRV